MRGGRALAAMIALLVADLADALVGGADPLFF